MGRGRQTKTTGREKFSTINLYPQMHIFPMGNPRVLFSLVWASPASARMGIIRKSLTSLKLRCCTADWATHRTAANILQQEHRHINIEMKLCILFSSSACSHTFLISHFSNYLVSQHLLYHPAPRHPPLSQILPQKSFLECTGTNSTVK